MTSKARVRRSKSERVSEILDAARREFTLRGYEATTMVDISASVGVVEGAIYRHFKGKRDILDQLLANYYNELISDVRSKLPGIWGARNRLRFLIWRHLTAFAEDPDYCRLVVSQVRPNAPLYESSVHDFNRQYTAFCIHVLEDGIASGEFLADTSPTIVRDLVYGSVEHVMWRYLLSGAVIDVESKADKITETIVRGISPTATPDGALGALAVRLENAIARFEQLGRSAPE